jgi:signal peptidase I
MHVEGSLLGRAKDLERDLGGRGQSAASRTCLRRDAVVRCQGHDFEELVVCLLKAGHILRFRARGFSMHPLVRDGDILIVRPVDGNEMRVGDIVLYRTLSRGIVAHRIVEMHRRGGPALFVVRGDATSTPDPEVLWSQVLGRVVSIERAGRTIVTESWVSRHTAHLYRGLFRVRRRCHLMLRAAGSGLRRVAGVRDHR